jgi:tetratricopeptide (TPR) repeat protein
LAATWLQAQLGRDRLRQAERIHKETARLAIALWGTARANPGGAEGELAYLDAVAPEAGSNLGLQRAVVQGYLTIGSAGDAARAEACYRKAWTAAGGDQGKPAVPDLAAEVASKLSQALAAKGDFTGALKAARDAVKIRETLHGNPRQMAEAYEALADLTTRRGFRQTGDWEEAMASYQSAAAAWEKAENAQEDRGANLMKMGDAMRAAGRPGALDKYRGAVALLGESGVLKHQALAAGLGRRVGEALTEEGDLRGARASLTRAIELSTYVAQESPASVEAGREVSLGLASLATLSEREGKPLDAAAELRRSAQTLESILAREPANHGIEVDFAATLTRLGAVFMRAGLPNQAMASTARGLALMKEMARRPGAAADDVARAATCLLSCEPQAFRDPQGAAAVVEEAIAASKSPDPELLELLSNAYYQAGNNDEGRAAAMRALSLQPAGSLARQRLEKRVAGQ